MQTKSRYEVIFELEKKKRDLMEQKDSFGQVLNLKKRELKEMLREVEDKEEEIKEYEENMANQKITIEELIKSVDESLERFSKLKDKQ